MTTALSDAAAMAPALAAALGGPGAQVQGLKRLSGGASQQTWAFELVDAGQRRALILRRAAPGIARRASDGPGLAAEAALIGHAARAGQPTTAG